MKQDSEIGVALGAGHPCYFVGFMTDPVPGQTIEDVCRAEAHFLERVIALHPQAESKPCLIGNCQARLADPHDVRHASRSAGADHGGGHAPVLLGGRARQEPDALLGRNARGQLADGPDRRPRATASSTAPI